MENNALRNLRPDAPIVVADGMGVDSWAMLIGWKRAGLPVPDAILFANTGDEKPETMAMIPVKNAMLRSWGWPELTILKKASPITGDTSLSDECIRKSVLPSLAYGGHSCSLKWKVEPMWAYCRKRYGWKKPRRSKANPTPVGAWAHGPWISKLIGYDAGPADAKRIKKAAGKWPPGHDYFYPLAEWGWDRRKCIDVIISEGLPGWDPAFLAEDLVSFSEYRWIERGGVPPKSSCFMCPASKKAEIAANFENHPELKAKAVLMEVKFFAKPRKCPDCKGLAGGAVVCLRCKGSGELPKTVLGLGRTFAWSELEKAPAAGCDDCEMGFPMPKAA